MPESRTAGGPNWRRAIPWAMAGARAALGPLLAIAAHFAHPQPWLGAMILAGFLSDVFDGIIARRWGVESDGLRVADSAVDTLLYVGVLVAMVERHPEALWQRAWLLGALLGLEVTRMAFDWGKFRRMASYHSYASKAWGIVLAAAAIAALCFDGGFWILTLALAWGVLCDLEGLAMSVLLPEWTCDVKTLGRAIILRRQMRTSAIIKNR
jgi:phosphatidylglycerophosphate synthase